VEIEKVNLNGVKLTRECIIRGLDCDDNDIIIISDLDEINNDEIVNINNDVVCFKQNHVLLLLKLVKRGMVWNKGKHCKYNILKKISH
jgi:hypothetical protein